MVRHYWKLKGEPKRTIFISRWNAYHGSTVAGVSLGGMKAMHAQGDLPIPGVEHVRQPYAYGEGQGMSEEEFCDACDRTEEHTSELQSLMRISYAVFCLKKKNTNAHIIDRHLLDKNNVRHANEQRNTC